jgi:hypothetical protein
MVTSTSAGIARADAGVTTEDLMPITNNTAPTNVRSTPSVPQPTNEAFWASAVPSNVKSMGADQVAFSMTSGSRREECVWDKKADALFVKKGDTLVPADQATRDAFMARLAEPALRAVKSGSRYDGLRKDVLEAKTPKSPVTTKEPAKKELPMPTTEANKDIYADLKKPEVEKKPVENKPVEVKKPTVENKPVEDKPVEVKKPTVENKPVEEKPVEEKPTTLTRADFVKEMSGKSIAANAPVRGLHVGKADLNADGVIQGDQEANALFDELNRVEKATTGPAVVSLREKKVQNAVDDLRAAPGNQQGKARYSKDDLEQMTTTLKQGGYTDEATYLGKDTKDYLGRKVSSDALTMNISDRPPLRVVHDSKLGWLKSQNDGPLVPMTQADVALLKKNAMRPDDFSNDASVQFWNLLHPEKKVMSGEIQEG